MPIKVRAGMSRARNEPASVTAGKSENAAGAGIRRGASEARIRAPQTQRRQLDGDDSDLRPGADALEIDDRARSIVERTCLSAAALRALLLAGPPREHHPRVR
jgi:hypothetical protein